MLCSNPQLKQKFTLETACPDLRFLPPACLSLHSFRRGFRLLSANVFARPEEHGQKYQNQECTGCRSDPEPLPVSPFGRSKKVDRPTRKQRAKKHPEAVSQEHD